MSIVICSCIILIGKSRISCTFLTTISFSLWLFYCSDKYKLGIENMKPPFSLTYFYFFFIFRKEQNLTRSSSQEIKKSFSLLRCFFLSDCYRRCYGCSICSKEGYCYDKVGRYFIKYITACKLNCVFT